MQFRNEQAFLSAVVDLAKMTGRLVHHDRMKQNVQGNPGFFDLVIAGRGRVLFWELKMPKGIISQEQMKWLAAVPGSRVLYPSDWDWIVEELRA